MSDRHTSGLFTPGLLAFLAVDVVLVVTFVALAAVRLTAGPDAKPDQVATAEADPTTQGDPAAPDPAASDPGTEPAPEESPQDEPAPPEAVVALDRFVLPSGNIWCSMTEISAQCAIAEFSYTPPEPPADCAGTVGQVLTVTADAGAFLPCVTEVPAVPADTAVLEYGQASAVGQMTCFSSTNGATCRHNATGAGFSVARAGYRLD